MGDVLWLAWLYGGYFLTVAASGFFLCRLCAPFVRLRQGRFGEENAGATFFRRRRFQKLMHKYTKKDE